MLHQVPRSHQQQVKKRKLVFLQSSPDYCRYKNTISHQTFSDLIIIFTFMIIRMNVTAGYKGVVGRTCKTDPNRCLSIRFEGLLQLLRLHLSLTWSNYGETLKKIGKIQDLVLKKGGGSRSPKFYVKFWWQLFLALKARLFIGNIGWKVLNVPLGHTSYLSFFYTCKIFGE